MSRVNDVAVARSAFQSIQNRLDEVGHDNHTEGSALRAIEQIMRWVATSAPDIAPEVW